VEHVAASGRVHDLHGKTRDVDHLAAVQEHGPCLCEGETDAARAQGRQSLEDVGGILFPRQHPAESSADDEDVGEAEKCLALFGGLLGVDGHGDSRLLRPAGCLKRGVPLVAIQVKHAAGADRFARQLVRAKPDSRVALPHDRAVARRLFHQNDAKAIRHVGGRHHGAEIHSFGPKLVLGHSADLVVTEFPDVPRPQSEASARHHRRGG